MYKNIEDAVKVVGEGEVVLLDVRTRPEHKHMAAKGSEHLELADIEAGSEPSYAKDHPILIHCRSGGRAGFACSILKSRGFTNVYNVGGLDDWLNAGGEMA